MSTNKESELLDLLKSEKKSIRIQAIVKLARVGKSDEVLSALQKSVLSDDRETSFFATQAVTKISKRIGLKKTDLSTEIVDKIKTSENKLEITTSLLLSPPKDQIQNILKIIRENFNSINEEIIPAVGVFLSKNGDISDAELVEKRLTSDDSALTIPFISAAEKIAPKIITRALPNLLSSSSPLVRSRAIGALLKIDPEEAERHFADFLSSPNPENRLAGIGIAFQFPFERAKEYILSILPDENDTDVITACQSFFASNPCVDTALRLLDIIDVSSNNNTNRLATIFKTICKALSTARIKSEKEASPESIIKLWKKNRLQNFLSDLEIQLQFVDDAKKQQILNWINANNKNPEVIKLIERLKSNPQTENLFEIKSLIDSAQNEVITSNEPTEVIKRVNSENFSEYKEFLTHEAKKGKIDSKRMALNCLFEFHPSGTLRELAKEAIKIDDLKLKIISLKILTKLAPNYLKENIENLLKTSDITFRVRVLRFALKHARSKAISVLKSMLKSKQRNERSNSISCLALCPFKEVRDILLNHLDSEEHPIIAKQIIDIFVSNPSRDLLSALDSITKISSPALSMVISQGRHELFEEVSKLPEPLFESSLKKSQEINEKPYSISNVRKMANKKREKWKPSYKSDANNKTESSKFKYDLRLVVPSAILLILLLMSPVMFLHETNKTKVTYKKQPKDWREKEYRKYTNSLIPNKFKMNSMCSVIVSVTEVKNDNLIFVKYQKSKILVKFDKPLAKSLTSDEKIKISFVPYRVTPSGYIVANGKSFELMKGN